MTEATQLEGCAPGDPCRCVASDIVGLLGRKYAIEVLCVVAGHEAVRFGTIEGHLADASTSTLSTRLTELVDAGLLARERYDEIPPRVEYELTADGHEFCERLRPAVEWLLESDLEPGAGE